MMSKELMLAKALFGGGGGGITPTGDITITQNGTYDVTDKASAIVAVPSVSLDDLINKSITSFSSATLDVVGEYALFQCIKLTDISIPNATHIYTYGLAGCSILRNISADNVVEIRSYGLQSCRALQSVSFPKCTTIESNAFGSCDKLVSINLPVCSSVGGSAFQGCYKLKTLKLPAFVGATPNRGFQYCRELEILDLGPGVTDVGYYSIDGCTVLNHLVFRKNGVVSLFNDSYLGSNPIKDGTGYIYVPAAQVSAYQAATNWAAHSSQFRALESYTVDGTVTGDLDPTKI